MRKIFSIAFLSIVSALALNAADLSYIKNICPAGAKAKVVKPVLVEGIVVSDYRSKNIELNPNANYASVDLDVNDATAYVQSLDGSFGVRVVFENPSQNELPRYGKVLIDLRGCTIEHNADPDCFTITGLTNFSIANLSLGSAADLPAKEMYISELSDADLYTFVTLKDVEMVFKDGTYADVYEGYVQILEEIQKDYVRANNRMDGWASLMRDSQGNAIYMLVNSLCPWRRTGKPLPQGMGPCSGVLVHSSMRRYGGDMGRYSIRPIDEGDIQMSRKRNSPWKTLTGWQMDGSQGQTIEFEIMGVQDNMWKNGKKGDRVVSDMGMTQGFFWTDSDSFVHIESDLNNLTGEKKGYVSNGAIMFKGATTGWFDFDSKGRAKSDARSFFVECSTKKAKGSVMTFNFTWSAGTQNGNDNWGFPLQWKAMCSINGGEWIPMVETATGAQAVNLRSLPWWDRVIDNSGHTQKLKTGYDCGLGNQHRCFTFPAEAMGKDKVVVRLTPANTIISSIRAEPHTDVNAGVKMTSKKTYNQTLIRFGYVSVDFK
ncbi:MAG: DUF5689 domain-containing protein [Bacteroidales bacterium]|nr:DUF5689 domain-containing protein [Bacteroidales bacterium]